MSVRCVLYPSVGACTVTIERSTLCRSPCQKAVILQKSHIKSSSVNGSVSVSMS